MRWSKVLVLVLALLGAAAVTPAWAHGHVGVGIVVGPVWWPGPWYYPYYPPPYYAAPSVVVQSPPVYIERGAAAAPAQGYWHYCANPQGYYPYVKECPGGWQKVPAQPPAQP